MAAPPDQSTTTSRRSRDARMVRGRCCIASCAFRHIKHRAKTGLVDRDNMAKKAQKRAGAKRARPAGQRDLVRRPKASAYAKRTARGRFKEMDDVGRSQKADKARKAKKKVRS